MKKSKNKEFILFDLTFYKSDGTYKISAVSTKGEEKTTFTLPFTKDELKEIQKLRRLSRYRVRGETVSSLNQVQQFGQTLFKTIIKDELYGLYLACNNAAKDINSYVRVQFRFHDTPELESIPWEFMYDESSNNYPALSTTTPIVRYLPLNKPIKPLIVSTPIQILIMSSNPKDKTSLDIEREISNIKVSLEGLTKNKLVKLHFLKNPTLEKLRVSLNNKNINIVHFIGHGNVDLESGNTAILFEDYNNSAVSVTGDILGKIMQGFPSIRLFVLNACHAGSVSGIDRSSGIAHSLLQLGIPAIIAMNEEITDEAAKLFSKTFYSQIIKEVSIEQAMSEARLSIFTRWQDGLEWGTPILYLRSTDGILFRIKNKIPTLNYVLIIIVILGILFSVTKYWMPVENKIVPEEKINVEGPTKGKISHSNNGNIKIGWKDNSNNEDGFLISKKYYENDSLIEKMYYTKPDIEIYEESSFEFDVEYKYQVFAYADSSKSIPLWKIPRTITITKKKTEIPPIPISLKYDLNVSVEPRLNTRIWIDGVPKSLNSDIQLIPGEHKLRIVNPDYPIHDDIINIGANFNYDKDLEKIFHDFSKKKLYIGFGIRLQNSNITVKINGTKRSIISPIIGRPYIELLSGLWEIEFIINNFYKDAIKIDSIKSFPFVEDKPQVTFPLNRFEIDLNDHIWNKYDNIDITLF